MYLIFTSIRDKATLERRDLHELSVLIRVGSASLINPVRLAEVMDRFPDPIKADPDWQEKRSLLDRPSLVGTTLFDVPDAALRTKGSMDTLSLREILRTLDGDAVLVFTASWCRPCHTDYDIYKDHFRELENKGVRVISYSVDQNHSRWERYVDKPGYLRECYLDTDASDSAWLKQLGIQSVPRYLLIDRTGEITGHFSSAQLRGLFDRYL